MILGIGVDATENTRMADLLKKKPRAVERLFSRQEQLSVGDGPLAIQRWAARFAAKEALIKACGGIHGSRWVDIEVIRRPYHKPVIAVKGGLQDWIEAHRARIWLSMTHERHFSVAMVVLETDDNPNLD